MFVCVVDNRSKARRKITAKDFTIFNQPDDESFPRMSPQLAVAAYQYLSTCEYLLTVNLGVTILIPVSNYDYRLRSSDVSTSICHC